MSELNRLWRQHRALSALRDAIRMVKESANAWDEGGCNDEFSEEIGDTYLRDAVYALSRAEDIAIRYRLWDETEPKASAVPGPPCGHCGALAFCQCEPAEET